MSILQKTIQNKVTGKGFEFDDSINPRTGKPKHDYYLNGKRMSGITTVLQTIAKPMLIPWAAKMAVEYIDKHIWDIIVDNPHGEEATKKIEKVLEEAKNAHRNTKEKAGELGTDIHSIIEKIIKDAIEKHEGYLEGHFDIKTGKITNGIEPVKQINYFFEWAIKHKVKFLATEKQIYSESLFCAGTCDFICEIDGEKFVGDLKTSGAIYAEYLYQVGAYRMMLEEMGEKDFSGAIIVRLGKDGKFDEDKDVAISYHYEDEKKAFLSALNLYRIGNNFKKNKFNNSL